MTTETFANLPLAQITDSPTGKPLRSLIGKLLKANGVVPTLIANPHREGELIAVVDHATAQALLAQKGHQEAVDALQAKAQNNAKEAAAAEEQKAKNCYEEAWRWAVLEAAWAKISTAPTNAYSVPDSIIRYLAVHLLPNNQESCKRLCKLLGIGTVAPRAGIVDWIHDHPEPDRALALIVMYDDVAWEPWLPNNYERNPQLLALATEPGVDIDIEAVKAQVQAEHSAQIKAKSKAKIAADEAKTNPTKGDLPLRPAAQAEGGGGGSKSKKTKTPAAPKRPKTSAKEALQGIAVAMQGSEEQGVGDSAHAGTEPDGASAVGQDGRATAPDAGAADTPPGEADPLIDEARRIVIENQNSSHSYVQRRLDIGYYRASRLLEALELQGVIGPIKPSGTRELLIKLPDDGSAVGQDGRATSPDAGAADTPPDEANPLAPGARVRVIAECSMKTTLNKIRAHGPCQNGWETLLRAKGKTQADDEPVRIIDIIDSNGVDDAIWCLRAVEGHDKEIRLFAVWCARQVAHHNPDPRVSAAIDMAEAYAHGRASQSDLGAARDAAWSAAQAAQGQQLRLVCAQVEAESGGAA